jgi:hypothetical protein
MVYASGNEYVGDYEWGIICGEGTYKYKKKGHVAEGTWKDGVLHGAECKYSYASGAVYYGAFHEGMMAGNEICAFLWLHFYLPFVLL